MATQKELLMKYANKYREQIESNTYGEWDYLRIKAFCGESKTLKEYMLETQEDMDTYDVTFDECVTICDYYPLPTNKEDEYYYKFCDYIMSNVNLIRGETSDGNAIADYTEFISRNYDKLYAFSKDNWETTYIKEDANGDGRLDADYFVTEWIEEIHGFLAGNVSEKAYKAFMDCVGETDITSNPLYEQFVEQEILGKIPMTDEERKEVFLGEPEREGQAALTLVNALNKSVGEERKPHHNRIYNQDILMEFAGYSKGEKEYSLHNDMTNETQEFENDDEIYDYLVWKLTDGRGEDRLYSYNDPLRSHTDLLIERVEHFDFDRISYEVVKVYPPQNGQPAAIMANPDFKGEQVKCGLFQTYDSTEDALGAMHDIEVQQERNKVYNDVVKVVNDIEKNVHGCYTDTYHYDMEKAIDDTVSTYGRDRVLTAAAIMILDRGEWDGRISKSNRDWAKEHLDGLNDDNITAIKGKVHNGSLHSILLEGFVKDLRAEDTVANEQQIEQDYEEENTKKI